MAILKGIELHGSISGAARAVDMTYRQVWSTTKAMNDSFPTPLVRTQAGVPSVGASLTPFGKQLLDHYNAMEREANALLREHIVAFEKLLGEDEKAPKPIPRWAEARPPEPKPPVVKKQARNRRAEK
jgi:molybdate transport system regulatory protein